MKSMLALAVPMFVVCLSANASITYELSVNGALAKVNLKVVDQDGVAVPDAIIWGGFTSNRLKDSVLVDGATNTNGEFVAQGNCNEFLRVDVSKEGYYHTEVKVHFWLSKADPIVVDGKWQPYGETRTVVLKKIKNPIRLRDPDARCLYKHPVSGEWTGFDLVCGDWVSPLGNGKRADMMIRYAREPMPDGYFKSLDISFTNNPYAGVYLMNRDSYSEMDSVYEANTNGEYVGSLRYEFERTEKGNHIISELGSGQYLVFRIRTEVDDDGNLISAHYGRIMGALQYLDPGGMVLGPVFYNPTPNDTNLEDAETARLSRLGYEQRLEQQGQYKKKTRSKWVFW